MANAILIMDMPSSCADCILGDDDSSGLYCVPKEEYFDGEDTTESRASFCPLREVPSKHKDGHTLKVAIENGCYDDTVQDDAWCEGVDKGYNACIDEILGGGE